MTFSFSALDLAPPTKPPTEVKTQPATNPIAPKDGQPKKDVKTPANKDGKTLPADKTKVDKTKPDAAKKDEKQAGDKGETYKVHLRVRVGTLEFINTKGDFLGQPYLRLSTYQHSSIKCVINDPDDQLRLEIGKQKEVEVEMGFVDGTKRNIFVGELFSVGRRPPDGTEIVAVDTAFKMQQTTGSSVQVAAEQTEQPKTSASSAVVSADTVASLKGSNDILGMVNAAAASQKTGKPSTPTSTQKTAAVKVSEAKTTSPAIASFSAKPDLFADVKNAATQGKTVVTPAQQFTNAHDLKFADKTKVDTGSTGSVRFQQSEMQAATVNAMLKGDVIIASGNTVKQIAPGQGEPSGCTLDYQANRSQFVGKPHVFKRMGLQLQSGFGSVTVSGWSTNDKQKVAATVVTQAPAPQHPTGIIQIPEWKAIKLSDPVIPGGSLTWADATKNGSRVPTKAIMERMVKIAQAIQPLMDQWVGKGKKFNVTSWYRDPASNAAAGGASGSRHMVGDAIDFYFEGKGGEQALHKAIYDSWDGGLAVKHGAFCHLDTGSRRRWTY